MFWHCGPAKWQETLSLCSFVVGGGMSYTHRIDLCWYYRGYELVSVALDYTLDTMHTVLRVHRKIITSFFCDFLT